MSKYNKQKLTLIYLIAILVGIDYAVNFTSLNQADANLVNSLRVMGGAALATAGVLELVNLLRGGNRLKTNNQEEENNE